MFSKKKKKSKNIILSFLIIMIYIPLVASIIMINIFNKDINYKKEINIKVGDEIPEISDFVLEDDLKRLGKDSINWEDIKLEDNKIYTAGSYKGYITFRGKKINFKLNVIDDEAPIIKNVKDLEVNVDSKINLLEDIETTDNSHDEITLKIEGEYDLSKAGTYNLKYVASDNSDNVSSKEFKLIVKDVIKATNNTVVGTTSKGYSITKVNGIYYINDILITNKTYNLPNTYAPGGLLNVFSANFNQMKNDAAKEGIILNIISGYRSYYDQAYIYNNYVTTDGQANADTYSARAGHSEHQTGLAADINSLNQNFINSKEGKWLNNNCYKYGFIIRYPKGKESITGYMYEPWHIRYVGTSLSKELYNNGNWISLEEYFGITSKYNY